MSTGYLWFALGVLAAALLSRAGSWFEHYYHRRIQRAALVEFWSER